MPISWRAVRGEASGIPDADLARLLAGGTVPPDDVSVPLQHVADVLAALRAAPATDEAGGKAAALAQFRQQVGVSSQPSRSRVRRPTLRSSVLSTRAAAAAVAGLIGVGGLATAAFAGALPSSAQMLAHDAIGAPSPHSSNNAGANSHARTGPSGTPVGPNASGPAAFGLCTAYANAAQSGNAAQKAVAFRNLEKAAGGAANVASFCASVSHPGASAAPQRGTASSHPGSKPTSHPTGEPTSHATGPPSSHPTGAPSHS